MIVRLAVRGAISATVAISGVVHAYLYVHGYRDIPTIGPVFLQRRRGAVWWQKFSRCY